MKFASSSIVLAALASSSLAAPAGPVASPNPNIDDGLMMASPLTPAQAFSPAMNGSPTPAQLTAGSRRSVRHRPSRRQAQATSVDGPTSAVSGTVTGLGLGIGLPLSDPVGSVLGTVGETPLLGRLSSKLLNIPPSILNTLTPQQLSLLDAVNPSQSPQFQPQQQAAPSPQNLAQGITQGLPLNGLPINGLLNNLPLNVIPLSSLPLNSLPLGAIGGVLGPAGELVPVFPGGQLGVPQLPSNFPVPPPNTPQFGAFPPQLPQTLPPGFGLPQGAPNPFQSRPQGFPQPGFPANYPSVPPNSPMPGLAYDAYGRLHTVAQDAAGTAQNNGLGFGLPSQLPANFPAPPPNTPVVGAGPSAEGISRGVWGAVSPQLVAPPNTPTFHIPGMIADVQEADPPPVSEAAQSQSATASLDNTSSAPSSSMTPSSTPSSSMTPSSTSPSSFTPSSSAPSSSITPASTASPTPVTTSTSAYYARPTGTSEGFEGSSSASVTSSSTEVQTSSVPTATSTV